MTWQLIRLDSIEATKVGLSAFERHRSSMEAIDPQQDLNWYLDGKECDGSLYLYLYRGTGTEGVCLLRRHYRPVKVSLGEFVVYRHPVHRFELWSSPVLGVSNTIDRKSIVEELVELLLQNLDDDEVLSIEGMPTNCPLFDCLTNPSNERLCMTLGKSFMHQSIHFPATYDQYLKQMSKRSRKSVQYSQRKLDREHEIELFMCDKIELIAQFLDDAITVSKKTYQWNLLGLGLRNRGEFEKVLQHWGRSADLRCFLLYCNSIPTAFMLGYIYESRYYYIDVGYDSDWAKHSVGSVLQLLVIEKLYELAVPPKFFDFSTGYGEHKGRFGNHEQEEVNMLVLPAKMRNRIFRRSYVLVETVSFGLVWIFEKVGIKKRLKKIIRKISRSRV